MQGAVKGHDGLCSHSQGLVCSASTSCSSQTGTIIREMTSYQWAVVNAVARLSNWGEGYAGETQAKHPS